MPPGPNQIGVNPLLAPPFHRLQPILALDQHEALAVLADLNRRLQAVLDDARFSIAQTMQPPQAASIPVASEWTLRRFQKECAAVVSAPGSWNQPSCATR